MLGLRVWRDREERALRRKRGGKGKEE